MIDCTSTRTGFRFSKVHGLMGHENRWTIRPSALSGCGVLAAAPVPTVFLPPCPPIPLQQGFPPVGAGRRGCDLPHRAPPIPLRSACLVDFLRTTRTTRNGPESSIHHRCRTEPQRQQCMRHGPSLSAFPGLT